MKISEIIHTIFDSGQETYLAYITLDSENPKELIDIKKIYADLGITSYKIKGIEHTNDYISITGEKKDGYGYILTSEFETDDKTKLLNFINVMGSQDIFKL